MILIKGQVMVDQLGDQAVRHWVRQNSIQILSLSMSHNNCNVSAECGQGLRFVVVYDGELPTVFFLI